MRERYMVSPTYKENPKGLELKQPKTDLLIIPEKKHESLFCRFSTNLREAVITVGTALLIALPFPTSAVAQDTPKEQITMEQPAPESAHIGVRFSFASEAEAPKTNVETAPKPVAKAHETADADTFVCYLTGMYMRYRSMLAPPDTTFYADIPFAYQDAEGNVLDYEFFEDSIGSYPAFFREEIRPPILEGQPNLYEILFRYRNKTLIEIEVERDAIDDTLGGGSRMEIIVNDSTSTEWIRATMVKWDDIFLDPPDPRCRGPPDYWWIDITSDGSFDDEFLLMDVGFSSHNPEYSGFQYFINLNYLREPLGAVNVPEGNRDEINGVLRPYPNPTNNTFTLVLTDESSVVDIKIYDLTGREIKKINGFSQGQTIDLKEIENPSGVYLISVFEQNTDNIIGNTRVTYLK